MMLIEESQLPDTALPVAALKRHLRLGSGFAEDDLQDVVLGSFLRAALAAVEARTGKALLVRNFVWTLGAWRDRDGVVLPVAPVQALISLRLTDREGVAQLIDLGEYRLEKDAHAPRLKPPGGLLPVIPAGGSAELRFAAGYAPQFDGLPPDLAQAVLLLAAHYYDYRAETALGQGCMPFGVTSLIARYRPLRVGFGS
ncbi:head-tail connector protein [Salipiger marinus]|uniref:head-tail connector protein n=1 Tax=Salipiger marinus TaxID=555512 RepID=UPI001E46B87D|nr:head-tail connector protein [Salipiger manganoxidans]MCD1620571.1 head-tail connector protein [Salipiger manganoxidans]MEB3420483.1 head-tail connector protein [Salipiger manganoxidans]